MKLTPKLIPRAALVFVLCALALLAPASRASAAGAGYGEITRFGLGAPGGAPGDLNDEHRTRLLGVDPTDNSAYVLDEPAEEEQSEKKVKRGQPGCPEEEEEEEEACEIGVGPITRQFRLQKFAASSGTYSAVASAAFAEEAPTPASAKKPSGPELEAASQFEEEIGRGRGLDVEGIAVDPTLGRVYVLAADFRLPTVAIDNAEVAAPLNERKALLAASTLYAYSTHATGSALTPAVGGNPVLAGPAALGAQSTVPGQALLEPAGITVDPETHDVIVLAHVDESGAAQDRIESGTDHFVLQRVHDDGTLGARYTDRGNFFAKELSQELRPHSPVVVGPEKKERVLVAYKRPVQPSSIVEVPDNFESSEAPKVFFTPPAESVVEEWVKAPSQSNGPNVLGPLVGGALSVSPEGTIFGAGIIKNERQEAGYQGVVEVSGANGSLEGWTGGQAQNEEAKPEQRYLCTIEPLFYNPATPIAAGSGGDVFVLAPAYLFDRDLSNPHEIELYGPPAAPAVIELGPGGSGCPAAKSRELVATLRGVPLEGHIVQQGEQVGFATKLSQADALSVEWDFGDGTKETVAVMKKPLEPQTKHAFSQGGKHTVTATIHTDDLATPTITLTAQVTVEGEAHETEQERKEREAREARERKEKEEKEKHETEQERKEREERERKEKEEHKGKEEHKENGPHALGVGPSPAYRDSPAFFDASPSWDSAGPNEITEYHWNFGDGGEYSGPVPIVFHTYSATGSYVATLTVTDRHGKTSAPDPLTVKVVEPPPPAAQEPTGGSSAGAATSSVAGFKHTSRVFPDVTLAVASLRASAAGAVVLTMYCPAGETTCAGTVKLRALVVVASSKSKRQKKTLMTLAKGSFSIAGGAKKRVTLHLSRNVLALLVRLRRVTAEAEIAAHDPAGATHSARLPVLVSGPPPARARRQKH